MSDKLKPGDPVWIKGHYADQTGEKKSIGGQRATRVLIGDDNYYVPQGWVKKQ